MYKVFLINNTYDTFSAFRVKVLFSNGNSILEIDVDTRKETVLVGYGGGYVFAMDYDYENRFVYLARYNLFGIFRYVLVEDDRIKNRVYLLPKNIPLHSSSEPN